MLNYLRQTLLPSKPAQTLIQTGQKWLADDCSTMGAALSYYTLLSLFPILLVALSVVGVVLGPETNALAQLITYLEQTLPPEAQGIVTDTLLQLNRGSAAAGGLGFVLLLLTASTVFGVLNQSVNKIWAQEQPDNEHGGLRTTAIAFVVEKLTAFGLVLLAALLLLFSLLSNLVIQLLVGLVATFGDVIPGLAIDPAPWAPSLQIGLSLLLLYGALLLVMKLLPPIPMTWKDTWPAALLTVVLLLGLQQLVSYGVIEVGSQFRSYGVVGGVIILLAWLYMTFQIFFLGCEFAYVYSHLYGSRRHRGFPARPEA